MSESGTAGTAASKQNGHSYRNASSSLRKVISYDEFLGMLDNVQRNGDDRAMARCPGHDDSKNSLSVRRGDDGRVLIFCHADCEIRDVCDALDITIDQLMPERIDPPRVSKPARNDRPKIIAAYNYCDESGELLYEALRLEPKSFRQRRPDGAGGWIYKLDGVRRVPYRLPELLAADPAEIVFITEGEKDCLRLVKLGFIATTNSGGAQKWQNEFSDYLVGRDCVVLPDNDDPGRKHAEAVARSLIGKARRVRVLELPELPAKGDVSDWLDDDHTIAELLHLVEQCPDWKPGSEPDEPVEEEKKPELVQIRTLTSEELDSGDFTVRYFVDGVVPMCQPGLVAGPSKSLKTSLTISLGMSIASGDPWLGNFPVLNRGRVGMISCESGLGTIQRTARRIAAMNGRRLSDYSDVIWSDSLLSFGNVMHVEELVRWVSDNGIQFLVCDPVYLMMSAVGEAANNIFRMGEFLSVVTDLQARTGATVALLHHFRKAMGGHDPYSEPTLEEASHTGFGQFARWWVLLNRREKYDAEHKGFHPLWIATGGSAGHSGAWAVDVREGDLANNYAWEVDVWPAREVRQNIQEERSESRDRMRLERKQSQEQAALEQAMEKVREVARRLTEPATQNDLAAMANLSKEKGRSAIFELTLRGELELTTVTKSNRQEYKAYRWVNQEAEVDRDLFSSESPGHWDTPGCPSDLSQ